MQTSQNMCMIVWTYICNGAISVFDFTFLLIGRRIFPVPLWYLNWKSDWSKERQNDDFNFYVHTCAINTVQRITAVILRTLSIDVKKKLTNNNFNCRWFRRKNQRKIELNDRLHDDFVLFLCARAHTHVFMMMLAFVPSLSVKCHQSVSTNFYTIAGGKVLLYTLLLTGLEGSTNHAYRKVASSRPVYYSISDSLGQRTQYISVKFPLHKQSENTARDFTVYI